TVAGLVEHGCRQRGCEVDRQHAWAADSLRHITIRPLRQRTRYGYVIVGDPLMAIIDGDLVAGIEVVIDLEIDLMVVRKETGSISGVQISCAMPFELPLIHGRIEPIAAVE